MARSVMMSPIKKEARRVLRAPSARKRVLKNPE